ncbi:MAG: tetratricopeptide repeat protein [Desulfovibrionaceae bacterium]|nr:tetratricopeptide repeat protein [Desulfovibrionaceae bacterium]
MSSHLDYEINKELGECYLFMGELDKAEDYYIKASASSGEQADPYMGLATIAMQRGDMAGALTHYSKAATIQESDKALAGLGLVHMNQGEHAQAFDLFSRALALNPANAVALGCIVREGYEQQRVEEIIPLLRSSLDATHDSNTRITLAGCLLFVGETEEARRHLSEILDADPGNANARELYDHIAA